MICPVDELESVFPVVERRDGKTFLDAELHDSQAAINLAADAIAPERLELGVRNSRHGLVSCEGIDVFRFAGYQARQGWLFRTLTP
jgi:hypothetical protein